MSENVKQIAILGVQCWRIKGARRLAKRHTRVFVASFTLVFANCIFALQKPCCKEYKSAIKDPDSNFLPGVAVRWTKTFIPTMKENPSDAEIPSHQLMLRAGLIRQLMAGAYTYLPLGWRSVRKAEQIVREEMERAGAVELFMPALQPIDLFEKTGRKEAFGNVLINFHVQRGDRKVHMALGPTHEEVITDLVGRHLNSYRQLPIC